MTRVCGRSPIADISDGHVQKIQSPDRHLSQRGGRFTSFPPRRRSAARVGHDRHYENSVSSESVIRDADMAEEMAQFTRNQIMMEASTSMLAQANQNSMTVLKLIG